MEAIVEHHERLDGSGYPYHKKGCDISLYGRIISIADVYDALISERSYKQALSPSEAFEFLWGQKNLTFDGDLIRLLEKCKDIKL
jgi:HD-GYP domain-containing protein (c-di-GMP phosphodiesterase class II)